MVGFIFCGKYINTDSDFKEIECDIYDPVSYFYGYNGPNGYKN